MNVLRSVAEVLLGLRSGCVTSTGDGASTLAVISMVKATPLVRVGPPFGPELGKNADAAGRKAHAAMSFIAPARPSGSD
jgi:hypothetical protein